MSNRKRIPRDTEAEALFRSDLRCVVCSDNKRGDQIHHIDGNSANNNLNNLAYLCFYCHDDATKTQSLRKKLTPMTIAKFRDLKYKIVATERRNALKKISSPMRGLDTEELLTISMNAIIILEIDKIKEEYYTAKWNERNDILFTLARFSERSNARVAMEIFQFFWVVASQTRSGMTNEIASGINYLIPEFFPMSFDEKNKGSIEELSKLCTNTAYSMIYDGIIYLANYTIVAYGLLIWKFLYKIGAQNKNESLMTSIKHSYKEIKATLEQRTNKDFSVSIQLIFEFETDLDEPTVTVPPLSKEVAALWKGKPIL